MADFPDDLTVFWRVLPSFHIRIRKNCPFFTSLQKNDRISRANTCKRKYNLHPGAMGEGKPEEGRKTVATQQL